jgi:hypothetical protein
MHAIDRSLATHGSHRFQAAEIEVIKGNAQVRASAFSLDVKQGN